MFVPTQTQDSFDARQPFSRADARAAGLTPEMLLSRRFHKILGRVRLPRRSHYSDAEGEGRPIASSTRRRSGAEEGAAWREGPPH